MAAPRLPAAIQALIDRDRARWHSFADGLRIAAVASLPAIRTRDAAQLFRIGGEIYDACDDCHREVWYPDVEGGLSMRCHPAAALYAP